MISITEVIKKDPNLLIKRDFIVDVFTKTKHQTSNEVKKSYTGKVVSVDNKIHVTLEDGSTEILTEQRIPMFSLNTKVTIGKGTLVNLGSKVETTYGRMLINQLLLCRPFKDAIPYQNGPWNSKVVEKVMVNKVLDGSLTTESVYEYIDNVYYLSTYAPFCVPSITKKAITVDPKLLKKKDELLKKYKDELTDPAIAMAIEDELIALDKATMKGDDAERVLESKNFDVHRKKMFFALGVTESFGDDRQSFKFGESTLDEGWKMDEIDLVSNDIRKGSYARGKETAKGGAIAKTLGRTFAESAIVIDDCRTKNTLTVNITELNKDLFLFRNIIVGSSLVELTPENIGKYVGKPIKLRSPMMCVAKGGYCYTCMDTRFKKLGIKLLNIQVLGIGSKLMLDSMKKMHYHKMTAYDLKDIDQFCM